MARKHYLISYDIADDKRRARVASYLEGQGDRVQYSVFFCDLSAVEKSRVEAELTGIINRREDQIIVVDLGKAEFDLMSRIEVFGCAYKPVVRSHII